MGEKFLSRLQRLRRTSSRILWKIGMQIWVSRFWSRAVPTQITGDEIVIRVVTSWHLTAQGLSHELFKNRTDHVSVNRSPWIEPWLAKLLGRLRIENRSPPRPNLFTGLAFVVAADIRSHGSDVFDSRSEYLGHADIQHGFGVRQPGQALPPQVSKRLNDRAKAIARAARYVADPKPGSCRWPADSASQTPTPS